MAAKLKTKATPRTKVKPRSAARKKPVRLHAKRAPAGTAANTKQAQFVDVGEGQILDNATGLIWSGTLGDRKTWTEAKAAAEACRLGGHNDWRLPTIKELFGIVDHTRMSPAIDPVFQCESSWYWSSTPAAWSPGSVAWHVYFHYGYAGGGDQGGKAFVRAVRSSRASQ